MPENVSLTSSVADARSLADFVATQAHRFGAKRLFAVGDDSLTYAESDDLSSRVAGALQSLGVAKGDVVGCLLHNSPEQVLTWFACAKIGAIWAPLNIALVGDDLAYHINDSAASVVIVEETFAPLVRDLAHKIEKPLTIVISGGSSGSGLNFDEFLTASPISSLALLPSDPLALVYTGGSTGMPKGVLVSHQYFLECGRRYADAIEPTPDDRHYTWGQLFHGAGQGIGLIGPMASGMSTAFSRWFSASAYWDRVRQYDATVVDPVGAIISTVLAQPPSDRDREHNVRVGLGVAAGQIRRELRDEFEQRFGVPLLEAYGQTETGPLLITETVQSRNITKDGNALPWSETSGRPRDGVQVRIADENGDVVVTPGVRGSISLRLERPSVFMIEYWRKPEATVRSCRDLWFQTGDIGYLDAEGRLRFTGRQAHWIRRRGENVSAFEVEQVLGGHDDVSECAVVGVPASIGDEDIKVYVQLHEGREVDPMDLLTFCAERLAYFKVPRYVEFVDSFPRSVVKKEIERHVLRDRGVGDAWDAEDHGGAPGRKPRRTPGA